MHAQGKKKHDLQMPRAPKRTIGLLKTLTGDKLSALKELGFDCLLQVQCKMWNHKLCRYVIHLFDPNARTMLIDGTERVITEGDVEIILGLNSNGADVPCGGRAEDVNCLFQQVAMGKVLKVSDLETALKDPNAVVDGIFKARLVLYIIATLLSPNMRTSITHEFLYAIQDVNQVRNLNWGKFVLDRLFENIRRFKTKNLDCISGCVLFLMLYFANAVGAGKDVVRQQDETIPRCHAWTDKNLSELWKLLCIKSGTKGMEGRKEIVKKWSNMHAQGQKKHFLEMPYAPKRTIGFLTTLTGDKLSALEELGFNCLLQVRCKMWNHELCRYVIDLFDPNARTMLIDGMPKVITERDVETILGLNSNGADVRCGGHTEDVNYLLQQVAMGKVLKVNNLEAALKDSDAAVDGIFKARLVLYIIATLLSPNTSNRITREFNLAIQDVNQVRNLNWGKFVLDRLCESMCRFKTKNSSCVGGCVLFIMLYFANNVAAGKDVVRQEDETIPRCHAWTDKNLLKLWKLLCIKSGTKGTEKLCWICLKILSLMDPVSESEPSPVLRTVFVPPKGATHGKRKGIEVKDPSDSQKRLRPNDRWAEFPPHVRSTIPARTLHPGYCPYDDTAKAILNHAFDDSLDIMEILCDVKHDFANRRAMLSLRPNCWVSSSIIDTVAARCNMLEVSKNPDWRRWFLPSRFASLRVSDVSTQEGVLSTAKKFQFFMHDISTCDWVYLPVNINCKHWTLLAVNLWDKCVYVLDTEHPRSHVKRFRECIYRRTLQLLQAVLLHKAHEKMLEPGFVEDLSDWAFVYPKGVPNQCSFGDYDGCGVYVIMFMQCENLLEDIVGMEAKMYDRFSIIMSLVDWESNICRANVITRALAHYKSNSKPRVKKRVRML